jgi:hypothetical protein
MDLETVVRAKREEYEKMSAEVALMTARVAGLRAEVDVLEQQLADLRSSTRARERPIGDLQDMARTDAIVAVLAHAPHPMHINEIVSALYEGGRRNTNDNYGNVSATIQMMLGTRVRRTSRGYYEAM